MKLAVDSQVFLIFHPNFFFLFVCNQSWYLYSVCTALSYSSDPCSAKHFITLSLEALQTRLLVESLNHAVWPWAAAIGCWVHGLNSTAAGTKGDGGRPCCHKTCWLEKFACFPFGSQRVWKKWPKPYVILHSSGLESFVSGEVTWAKHVHYEVRSEPSNITKCFFYGVLWPC